MEAMEKDKADGGGSLDLPLFWERAEKALWNPSPEPMHTFLLMQSGEVGSASGILTCSGKMGCAGFVRAPPSTPRCPPTAPPNVPCSLVEDGLSVKSYNQMQVAEVQLH